MPAASIRSLHDTYTLTFKPWRRSLSVTAVLFLLFLLLVLLVLLAFLLLLLLSTESERQAQDGLDAFECLVCDRVHQSEWCRRPFVGGFEGADNGRDAGQLGTALEWEACDGEEEAQSAV